MKQGLTTGAASDVVLKALGSVNLQRVADPALLAPSILFWGTVHCGGRFMLGIISNNVGSHASGS